MVKHTQTIHRLLPRKCLSVFDHFVGLEFKGLTQFQPKIETNLQKRAIICFN